MTTHYEWDREITRTEQPYPKMERPDEYSYHDFEGIAQLDTDITTGTPSIYDTLGLDSKRWNIIGINVSPRSGTWLVNEREDLGGDMVRIYAIDREKAPKHQQQPGSLHNDQSDIEVVEFYAHDVSLNDLLKSFKTARLSIVSRGLDGARIKVAGRADIPVQPEQ